MEERSNEVTIFRVKDEGEHKITVLEAGSTENEIRFYLNDTQYIKATDGGDKVIVELDEIHAKDIKKKESFIDDIKNNKKDFLFALALTVICFIAVCLTQLAIGILINNSIISSLWFTLSFPVIAVIVLGFLEYKGTTFSQKSKHSAEHMMVNFLEKNSRLPKNFQEIKSASRFSKDCGSRFMTIELTQSTIANVFSVLFSIVIEVTIITIIFHDLENVNDVLLIVMSIIIFYTVFFISLKLAKKGKFNFIINPIQRGLNYFLQCCNTTKKVKEKDILLAFYAAKVWVSIVYPEFYTDNELYCEEDEGKNV